MGRRRPVLLLLAVSVAALPVAAELAASAPAAADTSGSIAGTVTDAQGDPLAGICVGASWTGGSDGNVTSSNGTYTLSVPTAVSATVVFTGGSICQDDGQPGPNYAPQFYDGTTGGTPVQASATPVDVTAGQTVSGIDAVMAGGGSISGTVTAADGGMPITGVCVQAATEVGPWTVNVSSGTNGTYLAEGLPAGDYTAVFYSASPASPTECINGATGYVTQWYDGETSSGSADPIAVIDGAVTGSVDAAMVPTGIVMSTVGPAASPGSLIFGQSTTFSVRVVGVQGTPTGTVGFTDGTDLLCVATLSGGTGSCTAEPFVSGTSTVTATYSGDAIYAASTNTTSITVEPAPQSTVTEVQTDPVSATQGQEVLFSATVSSSDGPPPAGSVVFSSGSTSLCTGAVSNGDASCSSPAPPVGTDTVEGAFSGAPGFPASSGTTTLTVSLQNTTTTMTTTTTTTTTPTPTTTTTTTTPSPVSSPSAVSSGYDLVGRDGGVFVFATGRAGGYYGSLPGLGVEVDDVVGMVPSTDDGGYFLVGRDGGVFAFGDAPFEGSLPGLHVSVDDVVGIVPTSDDRGYFLVGKDGGVFAFGDAPYFGSLPGEGVHVNDIIGIAATPSDGGYWLVASDGTVYTFGDAAAFGSATGTSSPVSSIASTPDGGGYWIVTQAGGVYPFGDAASSGSLPALGVHPSHPVIGLVPTADDGGYWLIGSDGGVFAFGDAPFVGSLPGLNVSVTDVVGAVPTRS